MKFFEKLKLLPGLYTELKQLNENLVRYGALFSNRDFISWLESQTAKANANKVSTLTKAEILLLKEWLNKKLKEKGLTVEDIQKKQHYSYIKDSIESVFRDCERIGNIATRNAVAIAFGYKSFNELLLAYEAEQGGKR